MMIINKGKPNLEKITHGQAVLYYPVFGSCSADRNHMGFANKEQFVPVISTLTAKWLENNLPLPPGYQNGN